jgi:hypothetical protein
MSWFECHDGHGYELYSHGLGSTNDESPTLL